MHHALIFSIKQTYAARNNGAHRIATFLRSHGWDVEVVDYAESWPIELLKEFVRQRVTKHTVFFGFSSFFNAWPSDFNKFTAFLKKQYPFVKTIIGGQSVAKTPAENIEYWIDSFGEMAILELVKSFVGNSAPIKYDLQHLGSKKLIRANISYPSFPMDSYQVIMEKRDYLQPYEWLGTEFSRGCKFSCDFCNFPILGVKGDYSRTQEDFEYEMRYNFDNFGIKNYYVADETFNDRTEKIQKFADVTDQLKFKPFFSGFIRADLLISKPESWEHLARLNFGGQYYGIESFNHASAKLVGKGMHPDRLKAGLLSVKEYFDKEIFYRGNISLIVGLPHETKDTWSETQKWLGANWLDQAITIYPLDVEDSEFENSNTNTSKFGKSPERGGFRKIPDHIVKDKIKNYKRVIESKMSENVLYWEHDTMDFFEARIIAHNAQQLCRQGKLGVFSLGNPALNRQTVINDLDQIKNLPQTLWNDQLDIKTHIMSYISKKLN